MEEIISKNPANGKVLNSYAQTDLGEIDQCVLRARLAQKSWALVPIHERSKKLLQAREYILDHIEDIAEIISSENGKPRFEAIVNDVLPVLELLTAYSKKAPKLLKDKPIPLRIMKHRKSYLHYNPVGIVAIIAPWNYPFSIPFGEIILALLAGNAVLFKPSEVATSIAHKISEILEHTFIPKNLFQLIIGDSARGARLVKSNVNKIFFTGSVATGKKVMAAAAENLTPVVLELGGKDPMIIMRDANIDIATSAALWGGYSNSGQACASVERIIIHESVHDTFVSLLKTKIEKLRGPQSSEPQKDLGVITYEPQKKIYESHLAELTGDNAEVVTGGIFSDDKTFLKPTLIINPKNSTDGAIETLKIYNEETFGPVIAVTKFKNPSEAIEKANMSRYGLLASIFSKNVTLAEQMAKQIEAGSVLINEVLYTHGLPETPWGGIKDSGFGRVHSDQGFYEFVQPIHIHKPRWWAPTFKSLWWFPYTNHQLQLFRHFMELMYRQSIVSKLKALPHVIVEFVRMLKIEKRL